MSYYIPKVLLLGNGLNRAFGGGSWNKLLSDISEPHIEEAEVNQIDCPEPLKVILVTNDKVDAVLRNHKDLFFGNMNENKSEILRQILRLGFDDILTTNYSYELEMAALGLSSITEKKIISLMSHSDEVKRAEPKYLLHTFNEVSCNNINNRIWHIHGEARKPDSMILGHYYYANLIGKMLEFNTYRKNLFMNCAKADKKLKFSSWIDSFIIGDVYVLGFGFNMSEIDMWWLLNRKKREKASHGKIYYYNICKDFNEKENQTKIKLLKILDAEILHIPVAADDWAAAYTNALNEITRKMEE